MTQNICILQVH